MTTNEIGKWLDDFYRHSQLAPIESVFVLGCLERRRITVGAQQVRAINLIEAIKRRGNAKSLTIVGAGAAGVTAAAYAAYRDFHVQLVYDEDEVLSTFARSNRLLHPRLYEWPFDSSWEKPDVDLPLLNWSASVAREVADLMKREWASWARLYDWDKIVDASDGKIRIIPNTRLEALSEGGKPTFKNTRTKVQVDVKNSDALILAIGFGRERSLSEVSTPRYWNQDKLGTEGGKILVVGNGDGALTDLFRALVKEFDQTRLEDFLRCVGNEDNQNSMLQVAHDFEAELLRNPPGEIEGYRKKSEFYKSLVTQEMLDFIEPREDTEVTFVYGYPKGCATEDQELYRLNRDCFPLNRIFAEALFKKLGSKIEFCAYERRGRDDEWLPVDPNDFDQVYYRVGVERATDKINWPKDYLTRLQNVVANDPTGIDVTRWPLWSKLEITPAAIVRQLPKTRPKSRAEANLTSEIYSRLGPKIVYSDFMDSVIQAKLFDTIGVDPSLAKQHFLGVMRFLALMYDKIKLSDVHLFDGRFFLNWHEQNFVSAEERALFKEKVDFISRTEDYSPHQLFFWKPDGTHKVFELSSLPFGLRQKFNSWQTENSGKLNGKNSLDLIRMFSSDCAGKQQIQLEQIIESWKYLQTDQPFGPPLKRRSTFPLNQQFEDPGKFCASIIDNHSEDVLVEIWPHKINRTKVWERLDKAESDFPGSKESLIMLRRWYNRAYNRAIAKQSESNVFLSYWAGISPLEPENSATANPNADLSGLGNVSSDVFLELYRNLNDSVRKFNSTGDLLRKVDILQAIDEVAPTKIRTDKLSEEAASIFESLKVFTIEQEWIGDREAGPDKDAQVNETASNHDRRTSFSEFFNSAKNN